MGRWQCFLEKPKPVPKVWGCEPERATARCRPRSIGLHWAGPGRGIPRLSRLPSTGSCRSVLSPIKSHPVAAGEGGGGTAMWVQPEASSRGERTKIWLKI